MIKDPDIAINQLESVADRLFQAFDRIHAVGIGVGANGFEFCAFFHNEGDILPLNRRPENIPKSINGIEISTIEIDEPPTALGFINFDQSGKLTSPIEHQEQDRHRHLYCGLQIQNFDDDFRNKGVLFDQGMAKIGTLGCFVTDEHDHVSLLSNNHVIAAENSGVIGDRIFQPGTMILGEEKPVARLAKFYPLEFDSSQLPNEVDVAIARLTSEFLEESGYYQTFLPHHGISIQQNQISAARAGDKVVKVGRTTGKTYGVVKSFGTIVRAIRYEKGNCRFSNAIVIQSCDPAKPFADCGDSGSLIVKESSGEIVGLLYAGSKSVGYACPIGEALRKLNCKLA
jgi:hypothetical protein